LPADTVVASTYVDSFGQVGFIWEPLDRGPFFVNLSGIDQGSNFTCIQLRTRALNATYKPPCAQRRSNRGAEHLA
jgi:hypothetical protein